MEKKLMLCGLLLVLLTCGCAPKQQYMVKIDAVASQYSEDSRYYFLLPLDNGVSSDDLEYRAFADQVGQLLQVKGYVPATDFEQAESVIFIKYGTGMQSENRVEMVPVFGQVGTEISRTRGSHDSSSEKYISTTYNVPKYGVVAYVPRSQQEKMVTSYLYLVAFSVARQEKEVKPGKQLWQISATITDSSEGLRVVFPTLLKVVKEYIGKNTGKTVQIPITRDAPIPSTTFP